MANASSLDKLFLDILESENEIAEKRKVKSSSQKKLKEKQQKLYELINKENENINQIEIVNSDIIQVELKVNEKDIELRNKIKFNKYLEEKLKEIMEEKVRKMLIVVA